MRKMLRHSIMLWLVYWPIAVWLYLPTAGAGMVTDQLGWLDAYQKLGWGGIWTAFHDQSLHYFYHVFGFSMWKLTGVNGMPWMLTFTALHALAAALIFGVFTSVFKLSGVGKALQVALAGSILFFLSPYQTEAVVWYACGHYLISVILMLLCFGAFLAFQTYSKAVYVWIFYVLYGTAVFTLEISFSLPLLLALWILLVPNNKATASSALSLASKFVAPSFALVIVFFLLSKFLRGSFAGHYGADTHFNFSIPLLIGNLSKYTVKVFGLVHYMEHANRHFIYSFFEDTSVVWMIFIAFVIIYSFIIIRKRSTSPVLVWAMLLFACFALSLSPVLNLFFTYIVPVEGDRFSYWASVWSSLLISFVAIQLFRKSGWILLFVLVVIYFNALRVPIASWTQNYQVAERLRNQFQWEDAPQIYLLGVPDNYRGTYMFRTGNDDNTFAGSLYWHTGKDIRHKVQQVYGYNMNTPDDALRVEISNPTEWKVQFAQWGNWWWQNGIGGASYENDAYRVRIGEWGEYFLTLKHQDSNAVYLYPNGGNWQVVP